MGEAARAVDAVAVVLVASAVVEVRARASADAAARVSAVVARWAASA